MFFTLDDIPTSVALLLSALHRKRNSEFSEGQIVGSI